MARCAGLVVSGIVGILMKFEVYQDKKGEYRWRLKASNGNIMATGGEGYVKKADCLHGIERVKGLDADTPVEEVDG